MFRSKVRWSLKIFLILFLVFQWSSVYAAKRETKTLTLKNGLEALLVHDADVHRSAAALSIGTGHLYDPKEKMGLAHYLEHMLFLGTKKFPEVGSYKKYLNENSGGSNAYTSGATTNYFFQVSHEGFEGALDRFSDFFKAPLFDKKYAEREVNAVGSEHDKNVRSDGWRSNYIENLVAEEGHPITNFGTGNKETLAGDNQPALLEFYEKYYSASNMKLAMLSHRSLDAQTELVEKYFAAIPDRPVEEPFIDPAWRKPLKDKYRFLKIKMIKDVRSLKMEFPTIRLKDHQASKPASIIGHILGHEGKGSLLSQLKREGLVLGLSAGGGYGHPNLNSFGVNVSLTQKGVENYERVLQLVFSYIDMVKKHGVEQYTYDENAAMAQIDFDWKDPDEGMGFVAGRAGLMQDFELKEVETLPFLYRKFDPEVYMAILDTLVPENSLVVLKTNSVETDQKDKYYGAEYSLTEVGGASFEKLKRPPQVAGMHYPEKNDFIPYALQLVEEGPHVLRDDDLAKIWFQFDNRFKQPKVFMQLRIETPRVYDEVRHTMLAKLYEAAVQEALNEKVYPIQLAGFSYGLSVEKKGIILSIGGYNSRLEDLLRLVTKNLLQITIDEIKFKDLKEVMIRSLKNRKFGQAYSRASYYSHLLWLDKHYTEKEKLAAIEPLTLDDVKAYAKKLYERVYITGVAHGNWTDDNVLKTVDTLLSEINSKPLPESDRFEQTVEVLDSGEKLRFSKQVLDNNNALAYGIQVGEKSFDLQARLSMVSSIIESDFYTEMRTNQQLGYIVWSYQQRFEDRLFLKLVIQSATYGPFELNKRVNAWIAQSGKLFDGLTDEEFEKHRASLIISLEKKGESIAEVLGNIYYLATREKGDFLYKKKLIEKVKGLKKEDVVATGKKIFLGKTTPRLVLLIRSSENKDPVPADVLDTVGQFKNRKPKQAVRSAFMGART